MFRILPEAMTVTTIQQGRGPELANVIQTASAASLQDSTATELLQEIAFTSQEGKGASINL